MPASHIIHNRQSLFPGPDKFAETHDQHPSTSHRPSLSNNTGLTSSLQPSRRLQFIKACTPPAYMVNTRSKVTVHKIMYTTCSHSQYKVTPADDNQVKYVNPHAISTVIPLPAEIVSTRKPNTKGNSHVLRPKITTLQTKEYGNTRRGKKKETETHSPYNALHTTKQLLSLCKNSTHLH